MFAILRPFFFARDGRQAGRAGGALLDANECGAGPAATATGACVLPCARARPTGAPGSAPKRENAVRARAAHTARRFGPQHKPRPPPSAPLTASTKKSDRAPRRPRVAGTTLLVSSASSPRALPFPPGRAPIARAPDGGRGAGVAAVGASRVWGRVRARALFVCLPSAQLARARRRRAAPAADVLACTFRRRSRPAAARGGARAARRTLAARRRSPLAAAGRALDPPPRRRRRRPRAGMACCVWSPAVAACGGGGGRPGGRRLLAVPPPPTRH